MISFQGGVVCQKFLLGGAVSQFREDHFDGDPTRVFYTITRLPLVGAPTKVLSGWGFLHRLTGER